MSVKRVAAVGLVVVLLASMDLSRTASAQKGPEVRGSSLQGLPPVTAPPESFFARVREADREAARKFYKKHIDVKGMPVVAAAEVADEALHRTYDIVTHMLAGRPDILGTMADFGTRLIIIGKDQV